MNIEQQQIGSVTVLNLSGSMTLLSGVESLKGAVQSALGSGNRAIVLRLDGVPYIDSAGFGEIVQAYTMVSKKGGKLWLCDPTKRIQDLLAITKLIQVFDVVSYEDIARLNSGGRVIVECPVCDPHTRYTLGLDTTPRGELQACSGCGTRLVIAELPWPPPPSRTTLLCLGLRMPTYEGEHVELEVTNQQRITIEHRLDLYVSELIERLWQILPAPRRAVFVVDHGNATKTGVEKLVSLCRQTGDGSRAAVALSGIPPDREAEMTRNGVVFSDNSKAEAAVGTADASRLRLSVAIHRE
jgi:anti-sigma B factor antagonist